MNISLNITRCLVLIAGLFVCLTGNAQSPGFSLVVEDNTPHIDNSLSDKTAAFFLHNPVRTDIAFDLAKEWAL